MPVVDNPPQRTSTNMMCSSPQIIKKNPAQIEQGTISHPSVYKKVGKRWKFSVPLGLYLAQPFGRVQ